MPNLSHFPEKNSIYISRDKDFIALAKKRIWITRHIIFLIFQRKHMLWALFRSASPQRGASKEYPQYNYIFLKEKEKKCQFAGK